MGSLLQIRIECCTRKYVKDVEDGTEGFDRLDQIYGLLNGCLAFTRGTIDKIGTGQDSVFCG